MKVFLFILAVLAALAGAGILVSAKSAIHEIEAFILFLVGAVCLSGAAIVEAVKRVESEVALRGEAITARLTKLGSLLLARLPQKKDSPQ